MPGWWKWFLALLASLVTVVILLTGKPFGHYQIQLDPPLALWVGVGVAGCWPLALRAKWLPAAVLAVGTAIGIGHYFYYRGRPDIPREIAAYLGPRLGPDETFFSLNGYQVTYHLLRRPVPVAYVHTPLMQNPEHIASFRIDQRAVARQVIDDPSVRFVFIKEGDGSLGSPLSREVLRYFAPVDTLGSGVIIFGR